MQTLRQSQKNIHQKSKIKKSAAQNGGVTQTVDPKKFTMRTFYSGNGHRITEVLKRYWKHMNYYKKRKELSGDPTDIVALATQIFEVDTPNSSGLGNGNGESSKYPEQQDSQLQKAEIPEQHVSPTLPLH
jgi:hypothetical protein